MKTKSRRQFILEGLSSLGAWYASEEIIKAVVLPENDVKEIIDIVTNPKEILYAWDGGAHGFQLYLCEPQKDYSNINLTWKEWFEKEGIDYENQRDLLEWAKDNDKAESTDKYYECPKLDDDVDAHLLEHYLEWNWEIHDSPSARAYSFLFDINLAPEKPTDDSPLGHLKFVEGDHPGSNFTAAYADSVLSVYGLHRRLLEMGYNIELKFGEYW